MLLRSTALALAMGTFLAATNVQAATFHESSIGDAGDLIGTAADVGGGISVITGNNANDDVDVYRLYLGGGLFEAEVTSQDVEMGLVLFASNGAGLRADGGGTSDLFLPKLSVELTEGLYYLAIFPVLQFFGPVSDGGLIWNDVLEAVNAVPNGPGKNSSWTGWQLFDDEASGDGGSYQIALNQPTLAQEEPSMAVIPLPAGMPLLLTALGGLAFLRRRGRSN